MSIFTKDTTKIAGIVVGILCILLAFKSFTIVTAESQASVTSFGEVHQGKVLEGFNLIAPWWEIDEYNNLTVSRDT